MNPHLRHGREVGCVHVAVAEGFEAPDGELFDGGFGDAGHATKTVLL